MLKNVVDKRPIVLHVFNSVRKRKT